MLRSSKVSEFWLLSMKNAFAAPRDKHSSPIEPVPAKVSKTVPPCIGQEAYSGELVNMLKSDDFARSPVGRMLLSLRENSFLPRQSPAIILIVRNCTILF